MRSAVLSLTVVAIALAVGVVGAGGAAHGPAAHGGGSGDVGAADAPAHRGPSNNAHGGCRVPRLKGLPLRRVRGRADRAGCRLRIKGARVKEAAVQTVARQRPAPGRTAKSVTVWANPLCDRAGLPGPPPGEPIVTTGPTRLVSGLFVEGGPLVLFSTPRCRSRPARSWAGTITVTDPAGTIVATESVAAGRLATIDLAPGLYSVSGTFANATANGRGLQARPVAVQIPAGRTVRQDVALDVP